MNQYIAFRADTNLATVLQALARERNCSVSKVIRDTLASGIRAGSPSAPPSGSRTNAPS
jgi:hypothetical protein